MVIIHRDNELKHYGVKGTKWGIRRYQNEDGSYKPGAEGRYYKPVSGKTYSGSKKLTGQEKKININSSSGWLGGNSGGGGAASTNKKTPGNAKTRSGLDYYIYDVSEKLDSSKDAQKKKSGGSKGGGSSKKQTGEGGKGGSSEKSKEEKKNVKTEDKEVAFKISQLYDKISDLFGSDELTDEDWNNTTLSDADIASIDDLINKYKKYKSANSSVTKQTKKIDNFIDQYEDWKRKKKTGKTEDKETYLKHFGILGMHWGIRRYQNPDGTLTQAGKKHYSKKFSKIVEKENDRRTTYSKALNEFNEKLNRINSVQREYYGLDYYKELDKAWKDTYTPMLKEKYGDVANKLYKNEEDWIKKFDDYNVFDSTIDYYRKLGK